MREEGEDNAQTLSWNNLPILNEWKRRFPGQDPVKLHEQFWQTKLVCPGGGTYVWNEKWQTMESTVYGHPGEPKKGPASFGAFVNVVERQPGLEFREPGLVGEGGAGKEAIVSSFQFQVSSGGHCVACVRWSHAARRSEA